MTDIPAQTFQVWKRKTTDVKYENRALHIVTKCYATYNPVTDAVTNDTNCVLIFCYNHKELRYKTNIVLA